LLSEGKITARFKDLQEGHKKRHEVTVDRILAELSNIAFANTGDFFDWGPNGVVVKDKSTPEQLAVVSEVSQTITEGTIRVKLHSKLEALDKLAWHLGPGAVLGAPPGRLPRQGNPSDQFWEMRARDAGPPTCYNVRRT
jgi:Terminase small subunit